MGRKESNQTNKQITSSAEKTGLGNMGLTIEKDP